MAGVHYNTIRPAVCLVRDVFSLSPTVWEFFILCRGKKEEDFFLFLVGAATNDSGQFVPLCKRLAL